MGNRQVPEGHIELDPTCATAWVNDQDWLTFIVDVLGGCDGDDAVWVMPFSDVSDAGAAKCSSGAAPTSWASTWCCSPTDASHTIEWETPGGRQLSYPKMQSRLLPNRIDSVNYQYGELTEEATRLEQMYHTPSRRWRQPFSGRRLTRVCWERTAMR